ncbi:Electron transport complex protein RnfD [uncultured Alphaproteobacteria bacterium]|uniref:Ion-translocating oxidoreductase complex subunit D n=1 Tax=uncultured Alphaproteobacteria bacterium TaxID=91750 RepID=A0A212K635_9PROT|nr:Electron transport complex protein RnfD [uncultured Alphaproteobacteria bacterium]
MDNRPLVAGPFAHGGMSTPMLMAWVMIALTPATVFGLGLYGWPAIFLFAVTVAAAVAAEAACLRLAGKPLAALGDGSAALSGWILALTLPPWAPWWIGAAGAAIAMIVGKHVFGGLGQNLFNPAMVARVALLISFPLEMTRYVPPRPIYADGAPGFADALAITFGFHGHVDMDAVSSASLLGHAKTELARGLPLSETLGGFDPTQLFLGFATGSMGETSAALLLLGGALLLALRIVSWHTPAALILGVLLPAAAAHAADPERFLSPLVHAFAASTVFGALFIATDLVTSPVTRAGQMIFGAGCGVLIFVIRTWGGYPEGMAFAILLMNAATPLIDRWVRPRVYGRDRRGRPLPAKETR